MKDSAKTAAFQFAVAILGGLLLLVVSWLGPSWSWPDWLSTLVGNLGAFVLAGVAGSILFSWYMNAQLIREVLGNARAVDLVQRVGLEALVTTSFSRLAWSEILSGVTELTVFVAYARTWRHSNIDLLRDILRSESSKITIMLPNYTDPSIVEALATRFTSTAAAGETIAPADVAQRIRTAAQEFLDLAAERSAGGTVSVKLVGVAPVESFYITPSTAVLATFAHRRQYPPIMLQARSGGELYEYISNECAAVASHIVSEHQESTSLPPITGLVGEGH